MVMATVGVSGASMGNGKVVSPLEYEQSIITGNKKALQAGKEINAARNSGATIAATTQALANQTGGNILGFTYE